MKSFLKTTIILLAIFALLTPPKALVTPAFAAAATTQYADASCTPWSGVFFSCNIASLSALILSVASDLLFMAGSAFDYALDYSLNMAVRLDEFTFVTSGWAILRDVTNLGYIFILLFIAINIILGNSGYGDKSLIAKVLVTAVFVNFSLFGAKVIIDATNIAALQFYNLITPAAKTSSGKANTDNAKSITGQFMNLFNLQSIYSSNGSTDTTSSGVLNSVGATVNGDVDQSDTWWSIAKLCIFGTLFVLAVSVVFFAGAFLFISRTVTLFFLMLFASMAVASRALPATKPQFDKWFKQLMNNAVFAPIFLGLIYIFISATTGKTGKDTNLAYLILHGGNISGLVTFLMYMAFLVGLLLIAKVLGIQGGGAIHRFADKYMSPKSIMTGAKNATIGAAKYTGTRTLGRIATAAAESNVVKATIGKVPTILGGRLLAKGAASVGKATGYEPVAKAKEASMKKEHEFLSKVNTDGMDPQMKAATEEAARRAANRTMGLDADGAPLKGKWEGFKRFIGGKGTKDFQTNLGKKQKTIREDKFRSDAQMLASAEGINELAGLAGILDNNGKPNKDNIIKLYQALNSEKITYDNQGLAIAIGGNGIGADSTLGKMYESIRNTRDPDTKKDLMSEYRSKIALIRTKAKAYYDGDAKDREKEASEAKDKAKDSSSTTPKTPPPAPSTP